MLSWTWDFAVNEIFWIDGNPPPKLAVVLRPQGGEWLQEDLAKFKRAGIRTLVSLLEEDEAEWLGLAQEARTARELGMEFLSFPIPDTQIPSNPAAFREFILRLVNRLGRGEKIGVHCRGSIGRSTVTAAAALIHLGWRPAAALTAIEKARGCPVPDTQEQRAWILRYEPGP
jgi:protein-tyrosine phosphatase